MRQFSPRLTEPFDGYISFDVGNKVEQNTKDNWIGAAITAAVAITKLVIDKTEKAKISIDSLSASYIAVAAALDSGVQPNQIRDGFWNILAFKQARTKDAWFKNFVENRSREQAIKDVYNQGVTAFARIDGLKGITFSQFKKLIAVSEKDIKVEEQEKPIVSKEVSFDILKPLAPIMSQTLIKLGIPAPKNIEVLSTKFYNEVVAKNQPENFTGTVALSRIEVPFVMSDNVDHAKDAIITGIFAWITALQEAAAAGEELSPIEQFIADKTGIVQQQIKTTVKKQTAQKFGTELLFSGSTPLYIGGAIIILIMVFRK